jgi:hypothetical protein
MQLNMSENMLAWMHQSVASEEEFLERSFLAIIPRGGPEMKHRSPAQAKCVEAERGDDEELRQQL